MPTYAKRTAAVAGLLLLLVLALTTTCRPRQIAAYNGVTNGMPKFVVRALLGPPGEEKLKDSSSGDHGFGQGELERRITEGWIYGTPPSWGIEIYFDASGRVVGKNQGQG